jgi:hypothetical protein
MVQSEIPEFMRTVVTPVPAPATAADVATQRALMLDSAMMSIYEGALAVYQRNLLDNCPVILGLFTNAGGEFSLYRPGQPPLEAPPVPVGYQIVKSVGHSSMAVYQLVAPYLGNMSDSSWHGPMQTYRLQQQLVLDGIDSLDLPAEPKAAVRELLVSNIAFMDGCLRSGSFTLGGLESFARGLKPHLEATIAFAAETQVSHWMAVLDDWKKLLGNDWDKTYGVTSSLYVTRTNNILFTVMAQFFGREALNDRLLLLETTQFTTQRETMLNLLARIVADRVLGKVFFKDYFLMDVELLSTGARDAVAAEMAKRVPASGGAYMVFAGRAKIIEEARKRGLEPLMPPLAPFHSQEWPWRTHAGEGEGPKSVAEVH